MLGRWIHDARALGTSTEVDVIDGVLLLSLGFRFNDGVVKLLGGSKLNALVRVTC